MVDLLAREVDGSLERVACLHFLRRMDEEDLPFMVRRHGKEAGVSHAHQKDHHVLQDPARLLRPVRRVRGRCGELYRVGRLVCLLPCI